MSAAPAADWRLGLVLLALLAMAVIVSRLGRLGVARDQVTAAVRAVVQLALVSLVIAAVLRHVSWSLGFAALMLAIAAVTSTRRLHVGTRGLPLVGASIAVGALPVIALCLGSGVVPFNGAGIIPIAGILIGNAMTAATLTGRAVFHELQTQNAVYEGAIALGARLDQATMIVIEPVKANSLMPSLDQTRTVGSVSRLS
jgi:putative ABC transport system permease protein